MGTSLSKQGVLSASGGTVNSNLLLNSLGTIVDKRNNALDSRAEYYAWNVGQSYMDINVMTDAMISFDLEMLVRDITTYSGNLLVYNTNNKGPVQVNGVYYTFKNDYVIGDYIKKRIALVTKLVPRENPTATNNFIEFYTGYGSNNFYKISNVKIELGSTATPWIPNINDSYYISNDCGFRECGTAGRIYEGRVEAQEFYEI